LGAVAVVVGGFVDVVNVVGDVALFTSCGFARGG
jgi:hypothetical protein